MPERPPVPAAPSIDNTFPRGSPRPRSLPAGTALRDRTSRLCRHPPPGGKTGAIRQRSSGTHRTLILSVGLSRCGHIIGMVWPAGTPSARPVPFQWSHCPPGGKQLPLEVAYFRGNPGSTTGREQETARHCRDDWQVATNDGARQFKAAMIREGSSVSKPHGAIRDRLTVGRSTGRHGRCRGFSVAGVLLSVSFVAAACSSSSSSSAASSSATANKAPIRVGYIVPLTGVFTSNGKSEQDGFELGLKHFGSSVDGHPIDVTYLNGEGQPAVSLSDATQLVTADHVQLVEGPLLSSAVTAVAPYVLKHGVVEDDLNLASPLQENAYHSSGLGETSDWDTFQPSSEGAVWAYNTMHWRNITTVGLDISYGWQGVGGFGAEFTKLGGTINKTIWVPSNAVDMSSYISAIPTNTQAVFVNLSGEQAANFVNGYQQYGLKSKIPLMGITTLTDQAALPAEHASAALGVYTDSQYCDGLPSSVNQAFANSYHAAYGAYPSYYSEAGYTKAEILVSALKSLKGNVTSEKALSNAMRNVKIVAPRGPVTLNLTWYTPTENEYICKVEKVNGALRNVPIVTFPKVKPWGALSQSAFKTDFAKESVGPPTF